LQSKAGPLLQRVNEAEVRASIKLGRWFGVPVGLHYSWFVVAWLITLSLRAQFAALNQQWSTGTVWLLSAATAVLFFVSIVLHELAHATVARLNGIPVRSITLFALGGIAQIERDATKPSTEFLTAIAGPAASVAIAVVCRVIAGAIGFFAPSPAQSAVAAVLGWLAYINVALAVFNLIPGFPLDGGRVLRSILWAVTHDVDRATRAAARAGQAVGFLFIAGGLFSVLVQSDFGGLWLALIGWFLLEGAQAHELSARLSATLRGVRVADVMARECVNVDAGTSLRKFVDEQLFRLTSKCFAVYQDDHVVGLISPDEIKHVDRRAWEETTVSEAMRPLQSLHPVTPESSAGEALTLMGREDINQLPVVVDGHLEGVVTRSYLLQLVQAKRELEA
jgi:Zn-dependent protease/predicted transcriptional regulator